MFDVAVLERTQVGKDLLREQLLPMLQDENLVKVTCDAEIKPWGGG